MTAQFQTLLERFHSGECTREEQAELDMLLREDAGKRRMLVERSLLEAQLYKAFAGIAPVKEQFVPVKEPPGSAVRFGWRARGVAAAAVLLVGSIAWLLFNARPGGHEGSASIVETGQVRAGGATVSRLSSLVRFEVSGTTPAVIRLSDGTRAELSPATEAMIRTEVDNPRPLVELARGGGKFSVPPGKGRFQVKTPVGTVAVLGTEFTVRIEDAGDKKSVALAVAVISGTVRVQTGGKSYVLAAGSKRFFSEPEDKRQDSPKQLQDSPKPLQDPPKQNSPKQLVDAAKNDKAPERADGVLKTFDAFRRSITVMTADKDGEIVDQTLRLLPDVAVVLNGKPGKLASLRVGKQVQVRLSDDRKAVIEIQQEVQGLDEPRSGEPEPKKKDADEIKGRLIAVDDVKKTITVATAEQGKDLARTFGFAEDMDLMLGGKAATLRDLTPGMAVRLKLSDDRKMIVELSGAIDAKNEIVPNKKGEEIKGLLKAVDLAKSTVTVVAKFKGKNVNLSFPVLKNAPIVWKGRTIRLADMLPGMQVHLRLSENRSTVIDIRVDGKKIKSR
jgi:ferric-dicitrate binding protein FerR (iron transport regulator)